MNENDVETLIAHWLHFISLGNPLRQSRERGKGFYRKMEA